MITKIQKWGNSQGIRLTKNLLHDLNIDIGDEVDLAIKDGKLILSPVKKIRGRHNLKDLVARIPEDYQANEVDWGDPVGKEIW